MAKFYGEIGYAQSVENPPGSGIHKDSVIEFAYYGDIIRKARTLEQGEGVNSDISTTNSISIVANEFAVQHILDIRYVRWAGGYWTVTSVEVRAPRLILTLGGVYNGLKA